MPNIEILEDCQLEWDRGRGVLYVHNKLTGSTCLRICGLPKVNNEASLAPYGQAIDITLPVEGKSLLVVVPLRR